MTRNPWVGLLRRSGNEPPETEVPRPGSGYSLAEGEQRSRSRVDALGSKWGWFGDVAGRRIQGLRRSVCPPSPENRESSRQGRAASDGRDLAATRGKNRTKLFRRF